MQSLLGSTIYFKNNIKQQSDRQPRKNQEPTKASGKPRGFPWTQKFPFISWIDKLNFPP